MPFPHILGWSPMSDEDLNKVIQLNQSRVACKDCNLFRLCLPVGIDAAQLEVLDSIIKRRQPLKRGEHLFQAGTSFQSIYAVRSGSLKSYSATEDGQEQVTGFHLPGELLGLDALHSGVHCCSAKALETTSLCEIPYNQLGALAEQMPGLQQQLLNIMSQELQHDQSLFRLLGRKSAEERLAALLLSLSERYQRRGFVATEFHLSMSRNDIANYLGLAVETVSRVFGRFQEEGLLSVQRKHIRILDMARLQGITGVVRPGYSQIRHDKH